MSKNKDKVVSKLESIPLTEKIDNGAVDPLAKINENEMKYLACVYENESKSLASVNENESKSLSSVFEFESRILSSVIENENKSLASIDDDIKEEDIVDKIFIRDAVDRKRSEDLEKKRKLEKEGKDLFKNEEARKKHMEALGTYPLKDVAGSWKKLNIDRNESTSLDSLDDEIKDVDFIHKIYLQDLAISSGSKDTDDSTKNANEDCTKSIVLNPLCQRLL